MSEYRIKLSCPSPPLDANQRLHHMAVHRLKKPLIDGIVDSGVVPDDTPEFVTRTMPIVLPVDKANAGVYLTVVTDALSNPDDPEPEHDPGVMTPGRGQTRPSGHQAAQQPTSQGG